MLTRLNRVSEAVEVLQLALATTPENARWEVYQALAFAQLGLDRDAGIFSLSRAIESTPDTETRCTLIYNRGTFRINEPGDRAAAEDDFAYVIEKSTRLTLRHSALRARARLRAERHDYEAAIANYTQVLADADATPRTAVSAWMDRGALYREQGYHAKAIADWTRAITAADADHLQKFRSLEARAQAFEETGQSRAAAADYEAMSRYSAISRDYYEELQQKITRLRS
jgi:tetratricopeptide (TPR) repeat protein